MVMEIMENDCTGQTAWRWVIEEGGDLEHLLGVGEDHLAHKDHRCGLRIRSRKEELVMGVQEA